MIHPLAPRLAFILLPLLATAGVTAQQKLDARSFFPSQYIGEAFVDLAALRDNGIWDGVERSVLAMFLGTFEQEFGFPLEEIDAIRSVPGEYFGEERNYRGSVTVMTGTEEIGLPTFGQSQTQVEELEIGGQSLLVEKQSWRPETGQYYLSPKDGVLVMGDAYLMRPLLEGKRKAGVPAGELLSNTAGRGNLAYVAMAVEKSDLESFPGVDVEQVWIDEDPITFVLLRLRQTGEDKVILEARAHYRSGDKGREKLEMLVTDGLEMLKGHRRLGALKRYWNQIEIHSEGDELRATLDLGTPRQAANVLPMLLAPMVLFGTTDAAAPVAVPAAPAPAKPDSRPSKKGK